MAKKTSSETSIEHVKHADKRTNIPTEELRGFVERDELAPPKMLYPRDTSLDPQLVWQGKDEQDSKELEVPVVPIYIQEKIHPRALVDEVKRNAKKPQKNELPDLFADFNGIKFEDLIDFYQHEQNWSNRMILGDSLYVMASLAEKEGLKGKVQMIYMDPPYGIKFGSNWQVSTRKRDVKDGKAADATRQPEQIKAFRDTWKNGIHSYLSYLRDRLVIARELLTDTGSVFVQIGDENVHLVRCLLDEVFGNDNFISLITLQKSGGLTSEGISSVADYLLWYSKDKLKVKAKKLFRERSSNAINDRNYNESEMEDDTFQSVALTSSHEYSRGKEPFYFSGKNYYPGNRYWSTSPEGLKRLDIANRMLTTVNTLRYKMFFTDFPVMPVSNIWSDLMGATDMIYVVQTNNKIIKRCMLMTTDPGDIVLDPTCGSGTTAYVAEQWGRRWITIDTSRVALALARTRIMTARYPYYLLVDSSEGVKKEIEASGHIAPQQNVNFAGDVKKGFVYKKVPHITLKSIANNEEIDVIHAKYQEKLEPLLAQINKAAGASYHEWELPRQPPDGFKPEAKKLLTEWLALRRKRQEEIDASIAKRAEMEVLYDQPFEDKKRLRVSGPFTVESLSPHRVLSTDDELPQTVKEGKEQPGGGQFENMILEHLKKSGVQNTIKNERMKFDRLEPFAGSWLHAQGETTERDGRVRRVAVHIGPERGTVGSDHIKEAAKEAVQGLGFDILLVCGFAFAPHVIEETKKYGKLTVLIVRMNPDLAMGDELLKNTGGGNLFMVFGEPDVEIAETPLGQITVQIKGVDVYDPTTGEIRSHDTDNIACWFVDTNYNGESFFVRHAYFTGADKPYENLRRAMKADIDEDAWAQLYSVRSRPFDKPDTGKIAVKVINHYGDEVLKVFTV